MTGDLRLLPLAALAGVSLAFLAGVRACFSRPAKGHRYTASRVSGAVLLAEAIAIAASPIPPGRALAATALLAGAGALFAWAARTNRTRPLGLAFGPGAPVHLQTAGPYALVRHPFYTSYLLAFAGGWLAAGTPWLAPAVLLGGATYLGAARGEERAFLSGPLREPYLAYARRVGMFLPRLAGPG